MEYYASFTENEVDLYVLIECYLQGILKSKRNSMQESKYSILPFLCKICTHIIFTQTHLYIHTSMLIFRKKMLDAFLKIVNHNYIWKEELWVWDVKEDLFSIVYMGSIFFTVCMYFFN